MLFIIGPRVSAAEAKTPEMLFDCMSKCSKHNKQNCTIIKGKRKIYKSWTIGNKRLYPSADHWGKDGENQKEPKEKLQTA